MAEAKYLFDQGVTAINSFGPLGRIYVCPICATGFEEDALTERFLTKEHAPPRSAGGSALLLTCKNCNGLAGSQYDHQPVARTEYLNAMDSILSGGPSSIPAIELEVDGIRVNARLSSNGTTTSFAVEANHNNPRTVDKFHKALAESNEGLKINLKYKSKLILRRASISDLKSCFIILAAKFGYSYALHDTLSKVRDQLQHPETDIHAHVYTNAESLPQNSIFVSEQFGVVILRFFGYSHVMPWITHDYDHFQSHKSSGLKFSAHAKILPFPKNFEALLDRSGKSGLALRIEPSGNGTSG
jgi:hypothetical protein